MTREELQTYLDHFNNKRYEEQAKYYAPDVEFDLGYLVLRGPQAIVDLYREFHPCVKEHVEIEDVIIEGDRIAVVMPSTFECHTDFEKYGLSFKRGKRYFNINFIIYNLENDKFKRIRVGRYKAEVTDIDV